MIRDGGRGVAGWVVVVLGGVGLGGCLESVSPLTEEQLADIFGAGDASDGAETSEDGTVGEVDVAEIDTSTPADGDEVAEEVDADVGDLGPDGDADGEVGDTEGDTAGDADGDVDGDADGGGECTREEDLLSAACLPAVQAIHLFEPARAGEAMGAPLGWAREGRPGGASTWARKDEPVEIALVNGSLEDEALLAYFAFDGARENAAGTGYALSEGPPVADKYLTGQTGYGQALEVAPRYAGAAQAIGSKSFSVMGWFYVDQAVPSTAAYWLVGFTPELMEEPELALGVGDGRWVARVGGADVALSARAGGWQHLALTWDEEAGRAIVYVDGVVTAVETPVALQITSERFFVGALFPPEGQGFGPPPLGDEVVVMGRVLEPSEVRAVVQLRRPFGARLMPEAQVDFDDLRVALGGSAMVAREIIGRRPHGDSGAEVEDVLGVWPLDGGSLAPRWAASGFEEVSEGIVLEAEVGAFGDPGGAVRAVQPGPGSLAGGRPAWGEALTIELWMKVDAAEAATACAGDDDGAIVLVAQDGDGGLEQGWVLRLCEGRVDFSTSVASARGATSIADDRWHHVMASYDGSAHRVVIDGVVDAQVASSGTPADEMRAVIVLHRPPPPGEGGEPPRVSAVVIDDLVLHRVARPVGYAFGRAWPRLPHVRFLASTAGGGGAGGHALGEYALRAGNAEVVAPAVNACGALVSRCTGYVASWRFDRVVRGVVPDLGQDGYHLGLGEGAWSWAAGIDGGLALGFDGVASELRIDPAGAFGLAAWNVEVGVRPAATTAEQTLIERPGTGTPPSDVSLNFALRLAAGGTVQHHIRPLGMSGQMAQSAGAVGVGQWAAIGGGYREDPRTLSVSLEGASASVTPAGGPSPDTAGGPFFIGRGGRPDMPGFFGGELDVIRVMDRALGVDEALKYPPLSWRPE